MYASTQWRLSSFQSKKNSKILLPLAQPRAHQLQKKTHRKKTCIERLHNQASFIHYKHHSIGKKIFQVFPGLTKKILRAKIYLLTPKAKHRK